MSVGFRGPLGALLVTIPVALGGCAPSPGAADAAGSAPASASITQRVNGDDPTAEILRDEGWLRAHGIALVSWGPCGRQCSPPTKERVVVYRLTPGDVELLGQRYGAEALEVLNSDVPALDDLDPPVRRH